MFNILAVVIYISILSYFGYLGYKGTKTAKDYLVGGGEIHPFIMALSYGAAFISTSAIVGFGGAAAFFGMSLLWLTFLTIFVGVFVAFVVYGKRTRKIGHNLSAHTFPEFLAKRYKCPAMQKFAAIVIFLFMPIYAAAVMIGAAKFLEISLHIPYVTALFFTSIIVAIYVFFGGLKGVMYADAFQGGLMFVGMLFLVVFTYTKLGGVVQAHTALSELLAKPEVAGQLKLCKMPPVFNGWTSMPDFLSINWMIVVTSLVMGVGIGVLAQPQLAVKFMTVKSNRELNRAVPIGGIFILMMTGVAFTVGALSNVFFFRDTGKIAAIAAGGGDKIIPLFLNTYLPEWFVALFMIVLIAAGMSTLSSQFHAIATAFGHDLLYNEKQSQAKQVLVSRIGVLIAFVLTFVLAYYLPMIWSQAIARGTAIFFGLCAASFLPMYTAALYSKKIKKRAAFIGMITGFVVSLFWMCFVHFKTASALGICNLILNKPYLLKGTKMPFVDPIVIALAASIIVTSILTLILKKDIDDEHIEKVFEGI
jgi:SSS family solute:Na+ symporter